MKKSLTIAIAIILLILAAFFIWLFIARDESVPVGDAIGNLLPFGSGGDGPGTPFSTDEPTSEEVDELMFDENGRPTSNLFRLADQPVAGVVAFTRGTSTTMIRYVDRATGHIYEINPITLNKVKISNQTLPKVYEAHFRPDGQSVLLRSLRDDSDSAESLTLTLTPPTSTSSDSLYKVSATNLRGDIDSVSVGAGNTLFYSLRDSGSLVSSAFNNPGLRTILNSPLKGGWRLTSNGSSLFAYTKASFQAPGFAYAINTTTGAMTRVLGPFNGLTVAPDSSGTRLAYSYVENGQVKSSAINFPTRATISILPVTLAEKCVWSARNRGVLYCGSPINGVGVTDIDSWYQGKVSFSDRLWQFDTNSEIAQVIFEPKTTLDIDLDVMEPKLSPLEDYLIFTNKRDLSLWALKL